MGEEIYYYAPPGVTYELIATDNSEVVERIEYAVNNFLYQEYIQPISLAGENDGIYRIYYGAIDVAGNEEEKKSFEVILDSTPPETVLAAGAVSYNDGDSISVNEDVIITLSSVDPGVNPSGYQYSKYRVDNGTWQNYDGMGLDLSSYNEGIHIVDYYSADNVNNAEQIKKIYIVIDYTDPEAVVISFIPDVLCVKAGESYNLMITVSEVLIGIPVLDLRDLAGQGQAHPVTVTPGDDEYNWN